MGQEYDHAGVAIGSRAKAGLPMAPVDPNRVGKTLLLVLCRSSGGLAEI